MIKIPYLQTNSIACFPNQYSFYISMTNASKLNKRKKRKKDRQIKIDMILHQDPGNAPTH